MSKFSHKINRSLVVFLFVEPAYEWIPSR